jgi:hypothetical protein
MPAMRAVERCPNVGFARMLSDLTAAAAHCRHEMPPQSAQV